MAPDPKLLALDCAGDRLVVALVLGERQHGADEPGAARASARALPLVQELLRAAGVAFGALDAIAFGRGPGAFTGLRTACSIAQGLAFGLDRPVLALDSLALHAEDAWAQHGARAQALWVAMDARMDEAYAAAYEREGDAWRTVSEPALWTLPALAAAWRAAPPACVAGNAAAAFGARLPCDGALVVGTPADRVAALARLARAAWSRAEGQPAEAAMPLYLRDKVALTTREREERAAAKVGA
ncbi:MAG TPA: tRNA (adenosine(37)-N6)-threonylcarbamoyltransferase complex dimerization subunit type 1 TsaB [Burkholderiaceae bacterium]|nr:tRNA (adenosine(37)-N6)-threonylcarbamoyltransferase complex dimerization subunit type 1 TsaB [Burkholderiaceae bacterium]